MATKIRFCKNNKGKGKAFRRLSEEFPDLNIKIKECIKQCGSCRELPTATVDKQKVTGRDGDVLYGNIIDLIRKDSASMSAGVAVDK